jgi:hypothetical protein
MDCKEGTFKNVTERTCDNCNVACKSCENTADFCLICNEGWYFNSVNNTCDVQCPGKKKNFFFKIYCIIKI